MNTQTETEVPRWHLHRRLYNWMLSWADSKYGLPALCAISFIESSFFPIPPDVLLIPLVLGNKKKWFTFAAWCTLSSVLGGVFGYYIGVFAWETVGRWIVENIAHMQLTTVNGRDDILLPAYLVNTFGAGLGGQYLFEVYDKWNAWIVYVFGLTPLPYKLVTITAGVAKVNLLIFIVASILGRASRFVVVALVLRIWGDAAKRFLEKYFNLLCVLFVILLIAGFAALKIFF